MPPNADFIWMETSNPDIGLARELAQVIKAVYPNQMPAYNCSPSFNWTRYMTEEKMECFCEELAELGYKFQFITLAGFHALNTSMLKLAKDYKNRGMAGFSQFHQEEFARQ